MTRERFDAAVRRLRRSTTRSVSPRRRTPSASPPRFEDQAEAVLDVRPAAFSFVFGVPDERVLAAFRDAGVVTLGTATTPDEAVALDEAGHRHRRRVGRRGGRSSRSLPGAGGGLAGRDAAAGPDRRRGGTGAGDRSRRHRRRQGDRRRARAGCRGSADRHGVPRHRRIGQRPPSTRPRCSAAARGARRSPAPSAAASHAASPTELVERLTAAGAIEPYPYQSYLLGPVLAAARAQGRTDVVAMWSGQATPLLEHRSATALFAALTDGTDQLLANSPTIAGDGG